MIQAHTFRPRDLVAGHVALDLVNTVTARNAEPIDWLDGYPALLHWAELTGEFDRRALAELRRRAAADPTAAARAVDRTRELRETVLAVLTPILAGGAVPAASRRDLERLWKDAAAHGILDIAGGHASLGPRVESSGLDYLTHDLALRSVELLRTLPLGRTRVCPGPHCGWLFIDRSKGGQRRWCDMATCGNAAKSRRHYDRTRRARAQ